ncbi:hypothetical protein BKA69DRAFT_1073074 [Paraphysoderma sedebokerense]|nr:hypothetical protein BKA69DRAFT_1073074 [Paraphysoderma sedebokerense]
MQDVERHCDDIFREHELAKEQLSIQQAEKVRIVMAIERVINEIKQTHDHHIRLIREKETNLKQYARISTSLNNMISALPPMESQVADVKSKLLVAQRDKKHYKTELKRLRQEIDCLCHSFLEGERKLGNLQELAGTRSLQNSDLERELDRLENRTENNEKIVSALEDEKEKKLRELLRLESKLRKIKENLNSKEFQMLDASKRAQEMAGRLKDFATLYENVKNERNRYVNLLQPAQQKLTEMKEKLKIILGEIEILQNEVYQKSLELNKRRQENITKYSVRDNTRMEANQLLAQFRHKREQIDSHLNQIETLSNSLTIVSDDLQSIRERYESAIQDRNRIGIALLERNDELCIFYEKSNVQESVLGSGIDTLNKQEEVIKEYNLIKTELIQSVEHKRRLLPIANALEKEMSDLLQEVKKTKAKVEELGAKTESPIEPDRIRMLEGADPTQTEMIEKLKHLEERLALKEEKLLEKSLILEEVTNLTERLQKQAIDNRLENTELMTKLNELTRKINSVNKSMLAKLSELSMNQALSLALQKDQTTKEHLLHSARERLAHNQLPIEEFEQEFIKFEKLRQNRMDQLRQQLNLQERDTVGAENGDRSAYVVSGGGKTTAEQRPNAYIPSSDTKELPLPKPYGAFGPFKPTDVMGGNLGKYYKKMIVKPVEI